MEVVALEIQSNLKQASLSLTALIVESRIPVLGSVLWQVAVG